MALNIRNHETEKLASDLASLTRETKTEAVTKARFQVDMSSSSETELRETIRAVFRGKPVERVELFGSAARGGMTSRSDLDILVTPSPAATRRDLFVMAAELEDAVGRQVDFLIRADVEAMKNVEARDLILDTAVTLYVS